MEATHSTCYRSHNKQCNGRCACVYGPWCGAACGHLRILPLGGDATRSAVNFEVRRKRL
jgi:hypothetical protein